MSDDKTILVCSLCGKRTAESDLTRIRTMPGGRIHGNACPECVAMPDDKWRERIEQWGLLNSDRDFPRLETLKL